ncbi:hypothetical protein ACFFSH_39590 [Streptomyces filamentosus]|uniref:Uncharacterized protein n=1 Tax=Streptomyces filamentosus TaxID=67294 RepID=A0A919ER31_STRFL|nr:hypothetical protein [Streptomyces filamentosus]GHG15143.1 hypothetical protein GCM10017667_55800 [Streptomyces filamentosus]
MTVDRPQAVRILHAFAVLGCLAWVFGPQVSVLWRITLVALAVSAALATSLTETPTTVRLLKPTIPSQRANT